MASDGTTGQTSGSVAGEERRWAEKAFEAMPFPSGGVAMRNRFMLAPLTNCQSAEDGVMSDEEFKWLTMRAAGGHGATMTCAAHVQEIGKGFMGQLGIWSDMHLPGLTRLATEIKRHSSVAIVQVHHAGMKAVDIGDQAPVGPSDDAETRTRALSLEEVRQLRDDFVAGAVRAERAGFDGVELHGAHGYVLCSFLSPQHNKRTDEYGPGAAAPLSGEGLDGRMRLLCEIIAGIRAATRPDFVLGLRLSPERFGMQLLDTVAMTQRLLAEEPLDFIDISAWDVRKQPHDKAIVSKDDRLLIEHFTALPRGPRNIPMGVAGRICNVEDVAFCMRSGADFVSPGRASILQHDFPRRIEASVFSGAPFLQPRPPVPVEQAEREGISPAFATYLKENFNLVQLPSSL